jgi:hypothetical protein
MPRRADDRGFEGLQSADAETIDRPALAREIEDARLGVLGENRRAVLLVSVAMTLALAHALEYPGKMRLSKDTYLAVQQIYYPGFTCAGFAEPVAVLATLLLWLFTPWPSTAFWVTFAAFAAIAAVHAVYWLMTAPVNKYWVASVALDPASSALFSAGADIGSAERGAPAWMELRDRWEISHCIQAALAFASFLLLVVAVPSGT